MCPLFALLTAVHVVTLEIIGREECGKAILQCDYWSPEPAVEHMHRHTNL